MKEVLEKAFNTVLARAQGRKEKKALLLSSALTFHLGGTEEKYYPAFFHFLSAGKTKKKEKTCFE